jgi:hypothetical protein
MCNGPSHLIFDNRQWGQQGHGVATKNLLQWARLINDLNEVRTADRRFSWYNFTQTTVLNGTMVKAQERACLLLQAALCLTAILDWELACPFVKIAVETIRLFNLIKKREPVTLPVSSAAASPNKQQPPHPVFINMSSSILGRPYGPWRAWKSDKEHLKMSIFKQMSIFK